MRHLLIAMTLSLTAVAYAAAPGTQPLTPQEAKAWSEQMQRYERANDPRLLQSVRPDTKLHIEVEPEPGARVSMDLTGPSLMEYMRKTLAAGPQQHALVEMTPNCQYYAAGDGSVRETCTVTMSYRQGAPKGAPSTMYSFAVLVKDAKGIYTREGWVSSRKLF